IASIGDQLMPPYQDNFPPWQLKLEYRTHLFGNTHHRLHWLLGVQQWKIAERSVRLGLRNPFISGHYSISFSFIPLNISKKCTNHSGIGAPSLLAPRLLIETPIINRN